MKKYVFPSKILLFGEYGIIENNIGISYPYHAYQGILKFFKKNQFSDFEYNSNIKIKKYFNFIKKEKIPFINLDLNKFSEDLKKGLFFQSNIPQGYGLGSSGALIAAIYEKYSKKKFIINKRNIIKMRSIFSKMESFFHGKSSGIDPLICFLKKPIVIRSKKNIEIIKNIFYQKKKIKKRGAIFLINSGYPSNTSLMNNFFLKKLKKKEFKKIMKEEFTKYNKICIDFFLKKKYELLLKNVKKISIWIFNHFRPMIPKNLLKIWMDGIKYNNFYLKLCGSGGGGYILGFTLKYEFSIEKLKNYIEKIIFIF